EFKAPPKFAELLGAVVNVSAIVAGFLSTVWSILISMENRRVAQLIKEAGAGNRLFRYLSSAIRWLLFLAVLSAIGIIVDFNVVTTWHRHAFSFWLFAVTASVLSCYRILHLCTRVLVFKEV